MPLASHFPEPLRRRDQAALASLLALGAAGLLGWLAVEGGLRQRMIEADRPEPHVARFQVDVNAAEYTEWLQLPGIGEALAQRIIEDRQDHGPFRAIEDLRRVRGIGPKTLEKLRPYLRINDHELVSIKPRHNQ